MDSSDNSFPLSPTLFSFIKPLKRAATGSENPTTPESQPQRQLQEKQGQRVVLRRRSTVTWAPDLNSPKPYPKLSLRFASRDQSEKEDEEEIQLLLLSKLPDWQKKEYEGDFIETGHRPVSGSILESIFSWTYLHNEFVNIHSHLLAAFLFILVMPFSIFSLPYSTTADVILCSIYFFGVAICFLFSATFHTLLNHSHDVYCQLLTVDLAGIVVLMWSSTIPQITYLFPSCTGSLASQQVSSDFSLRTLLQTRFTSVLHPTSSSPAPFYHSLIALSATVCLLTTLHPLFRTPTYRPLRAFTFSLLGLATCIPMLHAIFLPPPLPASSSSLLRISSHQHLPTLSHQQQQISFNTTTSYFFSSTTNTNNNNYLPTDDWRSRTAFSYWLLTILFNAAGALAYGTRFPEKWFPRTFDLWGASHQILHVCVVVAAVAHAVGLAKMMHWVRVGAEGSAAVCY